MKSIVCLLVAALLNLSLPLHAARGAMVGTEAVIETATQVDADRARLRALLLRDEARAHLETYGITRDEAAARLDALSDEEIAEIAGKLDALPAGGTGHYNYEALGYLIILAAVAVVAVLVLIFEAIVEAIVEVIGDESSESSESADETPESADAVAG
jgi:hypothetical protein